MQAVTPSELLGTIGGNLVIWLGMSFFTVLFALVRSSSGLACARTLAHATRTGVDGVRAAPLA
eukprot:3087796-Rhodomonas_salina.1